MPIITLTVEQLVEAIQQLTPQEWERFERRLAALRQSRSENGSNVMSLRVQGAVNLCSKTHVLW
jgi:hypothetical protein